MRGRQQPSDKDLAPPTMGDTEDQARREQAYGEPTPEPQPTPCPECGGTILQAANDVWLDVPAVRWNEVTASWTLMEMNGEWIATNGDASRYGGGHSLHVHQPPEGVLAPA